MKESGGEWVRVVGVVTLVVVLVWVIEIVLLVEVIVPAWEGAINVNFATLAPCEALSC